MGIQEVVIALIFIAALFYVGKLFVKSFQTKKECGGSCKCGVDFSNLDTPKNK